MVEPSAKKESGSTPETKQFGLDFARFLNLSEEKREDLTCPICHSIFWSPVACNECENLFCAECINHWRLSNLDCPLCQKFFKEKKIPRIINNMLSRLQLQCENFSDGCKEVLGYDRFEKHQEHECEHKVLKCGNFDCGVSMKRREFEGHRTSCPHIIMQCQWCEIKIKNMYLSAHEEVCELKIMKCSNENCNSFFFKREHEEHVNSCPHSLTPCSFCTQKIPRIDISLHEIMCDAKPSNCRGCGEQLQLKSLMNHEAECELIEINCEECGSFFPRCEILQHSKLVCLEFSVKVLKREKALQESLIDSLQDGLSKKGEEIRDLNKMVEDLRGKGAGSKEKATEEMGAASICWGSTRKSITRRKSLRLDLGSVVLQPEVTIPESFSYGQITTILPLSDEIVLLVFDESRISAWSLKDRQELGHSNKHPYYEKILSLTLFRFNEGRDLGGKSLLQFVGPREPSISLLETGYMLIASGTQCGDIFIYDLELAYNNSKGPHDARTVTFNQRASLQQGNSFNFFREEENHVPVCLLDLGNYSHIVSSWGTGNECLKVWRPADFLQENFKLCHEKPISGLALIEPGKRLVSVSLDHTVKTWAVITNKQGDFVSLINKLTLSLAAPLYDVIASSIQEDLVYINKRNCMETWDLRSKALISVSSLPGAESNEKIFDFLLIEKNPFGQQAQSLVLAKADSAIFGYSDELRKSKLLRVVDEGKHLLKNFMTFDEAMMPLIMMEENTDALNFQRRKLFMLPSAADGQVAILSVGERAESFTVMKLTAQREVMNVSLLDQDNFDFID